MYKKIFTGRGAHLFRHRAARGSKGRCKSTAGVPIESISLSYHVTFSDLDLTKPAAVSELDRRIDTMAKTACRDLDKLCPRKSLDSHFVERAIASAGDQKKQVIAAAVAKQVVHRL